MTPALDSLPDDLEIEPETIISQQSTPRPEEVTRDIVETFPFASIDDLAAELSSMRLVPLLDPEVEADPEIEEYDQILEELAHNLGDSGIQTPHQDIPVPAAPHCVRSRIHRSVPFPGASQIYGRGSTFLEDFGHDIFDDFRRTNLYHPFVSRDEWEFTNVLMRMPCSLAQKNALLKTNIVSFSHRFSLVNT